MSSDGADEWLAAIERLERSQLDMLVPENYQLRRILNECAGPFVRIRGLEDFWGAHLAFDFAQYITDLLVGAHGQESATLAFLIAGTPQELAVYLSLGSETTTRALLTGALPGIRLESLPTARLAQQLKPHLQAKGVVSGIPSRTASAAPLEQIIRGMQGKTWCYIVQATPVEREQVAGERLATIDLLARVSSQAHVQVHASEILSNEWRNLQHSAARKKLSGLARESGSNTRSLTRIIANYRAQYLAWLLQQQLARLDLALASGQWLTKIYFGASTPEEAKGLGALLAGTFGGAGSRPDPLRMFHCRNTSKNDKNRENRENIAPISQFSTPLASGELALLMQLPREEAPGYAIHDYVRFDSDFSPTDPVPERRSKKSQQPQQPQRIALGAIQQGGRDSPNSYCITLDDLTKHVLVAGVTGSGKTTTIMGLLDRAIAANRSFLVIEPTKTEYRALYPELAERGGSMGLRIFTLGNERVAPFRLNPFEFETDDHPEHSALLAHIDFLKAVFNTAFILYAPMPYVLEVALTEIYEDKGWNLSDGKNYRLLDWSQRHRYPIFPTLGDLYRKVDVIMDRLKYSGDVNNNVRAALKARIGSMRVGTKGLQLDTVRGITMRDLLSAPAVLELENIGNDDEKTFLMGIVLSRVYEYRRLQMKQETIPVGLQHVLVFEEAHRLLQNTNTQVHVESSNLRAQAIEVFTNMLSEMRAYGQGVLVAEQIPSKITTDVLKNSNLKIVHRLTARDDRESLGQTMNLSSAQTTHLSTLAPGMASIYAEGDDHAYLVRVTNYKERLTTLSDEQLSRLSASYASVAPYQVVQDFAEFGIPSASFGGPDAALLQAAYKLLDAERSRQLWGTIVLRTLYNRTKLLDLLTNWMARHIEEEFPQLSYIHRQDELLRLVIVLGCAETLQARGASAGWPYPLVDIMRRRLTFGLLKLLDSGNYAQAEADLVAFAHLYQKHLRRQRGPYAGCVHCQEKCLYRWDAQQAVNAKDRRWIVDDLRSASYKRPEDRYDAILKAITDGMARLWLASPNGQTKEAVSIGYCAALQVTAQAGFVEYEQGLVGDGLTQAIARMREQKTQTQPQQVSQLSMATIHSRTDGSQQQGDAPPK
jgi:DNA helicase HerA-like ATPase